MNLKDLQKRTILMFGKSRAFSDSEFLLQMKLHQINLVHNYENNVYLAVDGKMMTPYEVNESAKLYEQNKVKIIDINTLDKALSNFIDEETLFMSLKLSHDKSRLKGYLLNSMTSDEFFLRIIKLYSWEGEDFFATDDNRDVSAAFISRFYKNIERNHNVQYSSRGFLHLIIQATDENLIEEIALLEPLKKSYKTDLEDINYKIITAIATHYVTSKKVLNMFIQNTNTYVKVLIAMRDDCDEFMQKELFELDEEEILEALSYNANLDIHLALRLMKHKSYEKNIAQYINLDNRVFGILYKSLSNDLAKNSSMSQEMQQKLLDTENIGIMVALASNKNLHKEIFEELVAMNNEDINIAIYTNSVVQKETLLKAYEDKKYYSSLAKNENSPKSILEGLFKSDDVDILFSLAQNPSTPIETLYQLHLDSRYERTVKENPSFSESIKTNNLGWKD